MIKAETIIHEGNPGPNWLDRCKAVFTPQVLSVLVILLAAVALVLLYRARNQSAPVANTAQTSRLDSHAQPLKVGSYTTAAETSGSTDSSGSLQPANNSGDAALPGTAPATQASTSSAATATASPVGPAPASSSNKLQSVVSNTLQQTSQTVQSVVGGLTGGLSIPSL